MEERIMTLHPQGKAGVNITRERYDTIRESILCSLRDHGGMTFKDLTEDVRRRLEGTFDGSVSWYVTTVKLDLEARGSVERTDSERDFPAVATDPAGVAASPTLDLRGVRRGCLTEGRAQGALSTHPTSYAGKQPLARRQVYV